MKLYRCQFCPFSSTNKHWMGKHYHDKHQGLFRDDMSGYRYFYFILTKKERGSCVICKSETDFNEANMKYARFCRDPACKKKYREEFKKRMIRSHNRIHLLDDPEMQKTMLANRRISGKYTWRDGTIFPYTGSYELDFLKFLDTVKKWSSSDILFPSPHIFEYQYQGVSRFYIPDGHIPSLNLEIEIKDDGSAKHINPDSRAKDIIKEELMRSNANLFNYIKIVNKDYTEFMKYIERS